MPFPSQLWKPLAFRWHTGTSNCPHIPQDSLAPAHQPDDSPPLNTNATKPQPSDPSSDPEPDFELIDAPNPNHPADSHAKSVKTLPSTASSTSTNPVPKTELPYRNPPTNSHAESKDTFAATASTSTACTLKPETATERQNKAHAATASISSAPVPTTGLPNSKPLAKLHTRSKDTLSATASGTFSSPVPNTVFSNADNTQDNLLDILRRELLISTEALFAETRDLVERVPSQTGEAFLRVMLERSAAPSTRPEYLLRMRERARGLVELYEEFGEPDLE